MFVCGCPVTVAEHAESHRGWILPRTCVLTFHSKNVKLPKFSTECLDKSLDCNDGRGDPGPAPIHLPFELCFHVNSSNLLGQMPDPPVCSDITNDQLGISGETGHSGANLCVYCPVPRWFKFTAGVSHHTPPPPGGGAGLSQLIIF